MLNPGRILLAATAALILSPRTVLAAEGGLFSLNTGLSLWTAIVFVVVFLFLSKFAWGPILSVLDAREKGIQDSVDTATRLRAEAEALLEENRRQLADARRQSQQIIAEAREAGESLRREFEERARAEGDAMIERARKDIERQKNAALNELREESVDLALAAATRLLQRKLDAEADRALIRGFIADLSSPKAGVQA